LLSPSEAAQQLGIDRSTLDRIAGLAPANLSGGPIQINPGGKRRHLRYPADTLLEWFRAATEAARATACLPAANQPGPAAARLQPDKPRPGRRLRDLTR
jgi:hypothetical protein